MNTTNKYEAVIGLEVHAQLKTKTKAYSNDENIYGAQPNTKTSVITLGHPGTCLLYTSPSPRDRG